MKCMGKGQTRARWGEREKGAGRRRFWGSAGRVLKRCVILGEAWGFTRLTRPLQAEMWPRRSLQPCPCKGWVEGRPCVNRVPCVYTRRETKGRERLGESRGGRFCCGMVERTVGRFQSWFFIKQTWFLLTLWIAFGMNPPSMPTIQSPHQLFGLVNEILSQIGHCSKVADCLVSAGLPTNASHTFQRRAGRR
jgi:hypothetical protein